MWKDGQQADWDRARVQHVTLAEAAKMKPRTKALLTDACRGHCNVRWVERHCRIPDGPRVGQPFRLHGFSATSSGASTATRVTGRRSTPC